MIRSYVFSIVGVACLVTVACGGNSSSDGEHGAAAGSAHGAAGNRASTSSGATADSHAGGTGSAGAQSGHAHAASIENGAVVAGAFLPNVMSQVRVVSGPAPVERLTGLLQFRRHEIAACYNQVLATNNSANAVASVRFDIVAGAVQNLTVSVHGDGGSSLESCLRSRITTWPFRPMPEPSTVEIDYTLSPAVRPSLTAPSH